MAPAFGRMESMSATRISGTHLFSSVFGRDRTAIGASAGAIADVADTLAAAVGIRPVGRTRLRLAAQLHDVGMLAIPPSVLDKRGPLERCEWAQIRLHPAIGELLLNVEGLVEIAPWVRSHHERPDGRGYPDGLRGEEIPVEARILAIADAFQALNCERPHRPALSPEAARAELVRGASTLQFDPGLVAMFLAA